MLFTYFSLGIPDKLASERVADISSGSFLAEYSFFRLIIFTRYKIAYLYTNRFTVLAHYNNNYKKIYLN